MSDRDIIYTLTSSILLVNVQGHPKYIYLKKYNAIWTPFKRENCLFLILKKILVDILVDKMRQPPKVSMPLI
jgi:hypothetical protein